MWKTQPHRFNRSTHRISCEHASTASSSWTRIFFNRCELLFINLAARNLTDSLKSTHNSEVTTSKFPRLNGSPIDKDRGNIHTCHRQHGARHIFIAATNGQNTIHALAIACRFNRISDHLTAHQGIFHSFGAHRNAITHSDRAKHLRHSPCLSSRVFGTSGQSIQSHVARSDRAVAVCDPDDWLAKIIITKTNRSQHCSIG